MYVDENTGKEYKIIGICVCGIQEENVYDVVKSICRYAEKHSFKVLLFSSFDDMYNDTLFTRAASSIFSLINTALLDALIILPESIKSDRVTNKIISDARAMDLPIISIDRDIEGCSSIMFDYVNTFEKIVRHIIEEHGCRRVNLVAGFEGNSFSEERVDVFKKVLAENDIEFDPDRLGYGDFWTEPTQKVVEGFLSSGKELPEAIICCNDTMAITTVQVLRKHGIKVPDDILVTGFDGITLQKYYVPNITTAAPDIDQVGIKALEMINEALAGNRSVRKEYVPYKLMLTESCGCKQHSGEIAGDKIIELYDMTAVYDGHEKIMFGYLSRSMECRDISDITELMVNHADFHYTWCCINSDFLTAKKDPVRCYEHFTSRMVILAEMNGMNKREEQSQFPVNRLLPELGYALDTHNSIMFSPMHFIGEVIGYIAVDFDDDKLNLKNVHRFISNTNQILENYKNRINLEHANEVLEEMHIRDSLTGIFNRRGFYKHAMQIIRKSRIRRKNVIIYSIDMDGLKFINDTFGHTEGDKAIKAISDTLVKSAGEEGICARFGGDEFSVLINADELSSGDEFIQRVEAELERLNTNGRFPYKIAMSCGYEVIYYDDDDSIDEALRKADIKMYKTKRLKKSKPAAETERSPMSDNYRNRLTQLLLNDDSDLYFYINYVSNTWVTASNSHLLPAINSSEYDPIAALLESGRIAAEDMGNYNVFMNKIMYGVNEGSTDTKLSVSFRIRNDDRNEWYNMSVLLIKNDSRTTEAVGRVHKLTEREAMEKQILLSFASDNEPPLVEQAFSKRLLKNDDKMALVQFDIAKFKVVNEVYGVEAGDEILRYITESLASFCNEDEPFVRLSADVFMMLICYTDKSDIIRAIRELEKGIKDYKGMKYSFIFGVYMVSDRNQPLRYMIDCATIARSSVKGNAIDNIGFYNEDLKRSIMLRKSIEDMMHTSLDSGHFKMYLQPKYDIKTDKIIGSEALIRWEQEDGSLMQPNDFIPVFEQNGFIVKIDEYMWEQACKNISKRLKAGKHTVPISVNVSRIHLSDNDYLKKLNSLCSEYGIDKKYIELEITETIENVNSSDAIIAAKAEGYKLLMDDFGSGYSSLGTLKSTPFDVLKIDTKFLSSSMTSERGKKIIEHIISMSKDIGLEVIAEGVETQEQAEFLKKCGCDAAQGFYYSRPVPPDVLGAMLESEYSVIWE
ncbi:MAG: EAL domain-containing protein [Ruminococcus sp.]|nr:EAL domain-containing protein [Ruminococcus sp.]